MALVAVVMEERDLATLLLTCRLAADTYREEAVDLAREVMACAPEPGTLPGLKEAERCVRKSQLLYETHNRIAQALPASWSKKE